MTDDELAAAPTVVLPILPGAGWAPTVVVAGRPRPPWTRRRLAGWVVAMVIVVVLTVPISCYLGAMAIIAG